jgi:peptidoglycan/xylan/chitin deacetylase (PgdA/CDA1 family)
VERAEWGAGKTNYLSITFDDGYRDNFLYAVPLLKKYNLPACIFISTGPIDGTALLWPDAVRYVLYRAGDGKRDSLAIGEGVLPRPFLPGRYSRINALKMALAVLKTLPDEEKWLSIRKLSQVFSLDLADMPKDSIMDWHVVRQLAKTDISVGSHTVTHPTLRNLPPDKLLAEVTESKRRLEEETGRKVSFFAYPNGTAKDLSRQVVSAVRSVGYKAAFTTIRGINEPRVDLFHLRRTGVYRTDGVAELATKLFFEKALSARNWAEAPQPEE